MIQIRQIKLPFHHTKEDLIKMAADKLKIAPGQISQMTIARQSLDARQSLHGRKKDGIQLIYSVDVALPFEDKVLRRAASPEIMKKPAEEYVYAITGEKKPRFRPVVAGSGPAGLFCAYYLALCGFSPIILERGSKVEERMQKVKHFWETGVLDQQDNLQFGEGGAGTFSDGKLNTLIKDQNNRIRRVLTLFAEHGAPADILYLNKPHIGTDYLVQVVQNIRQQIHLLGGEFRFGTMLTDIHAEEGQLKRITVQKGGQSMEMDCEILILAIGHSARDTFSMLYERGLDMEAKAFAAGLRIEHEQAFINRSQYGAALDGLPPADYKLTHQSRNGRGVFTFCMCPGGSVVDASSETGYLNINGMSRYARDGRNANSAVVATVTPQDFIRETGNETALAGIAFQQKYEALAYQACGGAIPVQRFGDLTKGIKSVTLGHIRPDAKGRTKPGGLLGLLPDYVLAAILEGIQAFDQKIKGFGQDDALLSGIEMRTSSPVRILRGSRGMGSISGIYPCGEGAGYAGGITSSSVDGIKTFEAVIKDYRP